MMLRRTKIIATLGPATDAEGVLLRLLESGTDLVRLNFSHGTVSDHIQRIEEVRKLATALNKEVGIIADLQGPKIRIAKFKNKSIYLSKGAPFLLDAHLPSEEGNEKAVGLDYKDLTKDVSSGDILLLDDGRIVLKVQKVAQEKIHCVVQVGGALSNNKGVNRLGGGLSAKALTNKDKQDLKAAVEMGVDYIAISFPRSADDIHEARHLIQQAEGQAGIIAKIERAEAIQELDKIIAASDGIMVARGDLGVEIGDAELPAIQKEIINRCRAANKPVITATQMMESMIHNAIPTRAEVFDVSNAVLDGTDAVMLSAETASGEHPDRVVEAMSRICIGAEKNPITRISRHRVECHFTRIDEAIAMATMYTANHMDTKGIVALTESGSTPLWMSRIRSGIPIFALCRNSASRRKMTLYRGVYPLSFDVMQYSLNEINQRAIDFLVEQGLLTKGDLAIITHGNHLGVHGGTDAMKIMAVE